MQYGWKKIEDVLYIYYIRMSPWMALEHRHSLLFEWFLTQLETSLSISHESRSKPLTRLSTMLSKKFHVYLGALRRRRSATHRLKRARPAASTKKWTRSIQLGIFQPNNQSGLGPLFHHAHLSFFFAPSYSPKSSVEREFTPWVQQMGCWSQGPDGF